MNSKNESCAIITPARAWPSMAEVGLRQLWHAFVIASHCSLHRVTELITILEQYQWCCVCVMCCELVHHVDQSCIMPINCAVIVFTRGSTTVYIGHNPF